MASSIITDDWKSIVLPLITPRSFGTRLDKGMTADEINDRIEVGGVSDDVNSHWILYNLVLLATEI